MDASPYLCLLCFPFFSEVTGSRGGGVWPGAAPGAPPPPGDQTEGKAHLEHPDVGLAVLSATAGCLGHTFFIWKKIFKFGNFQNFWIFKNLWNVQKWSLKMYFKEIWKLCKQRKKVCSEARCIQDSACYIFPVLQTIGRRAKTDSSSERSPGIHYHTGVIIRHINNDIFV